MKSLSSKEKGFLGEERVVNFLMEKNYQILFRNWRTKFGEIDIIALDKSNKKGNTLVFFEVKTLPSGNAETLEKELSFTKQKKIVKTSKCFLLEYRQYKYDYIIENNGSLEQLDSTIDVFVKTHETVSPFCKKVEAKVFAN